VLVIIVILILVYLLSLTSSLSVCYLVGMLQIYFLEKISYTVS